MVSSLWPQYFSERLLEPKIPVLPCRYLNYMLPKMNQKILLWTHKGSEMISRCDVSLAKGEEIVCVIR